MTRPQRAGKRSVSSIERRSHTEWRRIRSPSGNTINMVRKAWIAILVFAVLLHAGIGAILVYSTLCSPHPFRYPEIWEVCLFFFILVGCDCVALSRRILDDDGELLCLRL